MISFRLICLVITFIKLSGDLYLSSIVINTRLISWIISKLIFKLMILLLFTIIFLVIIYWKMMSYSLWNHWTINWILSLKISFIKFNSKLFNIQLLIFKDKITHFLLLIGYSQLLKIYLIFLLLISITKILLCNSSLNSSSVISILLF
jgi:hypothetical protein